jgi:hypothetical protein
MRCSLDEMPPSIMMVPDLNGVMVHLVHTYGQLTPEDVSAYVTMFSGQETHQAQNNVQLYYCVVNTLTERGYVCIVYDAELYKMEGTHIGTMLLNLIMQKANTDTRSNALYRVFN